jgi:hypothetical protein
MARELTFAKDKTVNYKLTRLGCTSGRIKCVFSRIKTPPKPKTFFKKNIKILNEIF